MPFDGSRNADLATRLAWSGIVPVPDAVLEAHKAEEIRKHPPSWLYRHRGSFPDFLVFGSLSMAIGVGISVTVRHWSTEPDRLVSIMSGLLVVIATFVLLVFVAAIVAGLAGVKGPAEWRQREYGDQKMPGALRDVARIARGAEPNARLIIGELIQDRVVLDPYLLLAYRGERVCLGIWDGDRVIEIATKGDV